jgi:hypothetical protein
VPVLRGWHSKANAETVWALSGHWADATLQDRWQPRAVPVPLLCRRYAFGERQIELSLWSKA